MREPEEVTYESAHEHSEPRRPADTSWGVGPWPLQKPPGPRQWPTRLTALRTRSLRAITLRPVRAPLNTSGPREPFPRR